MSSRCLAAALALALSGAARAAEKPEDNDVYVYPLLKVPSFNLTVAPHGASDDDDDDDSAPGSTELKPTIRSEFGLAAAWRGYRASLTAPVGGSDQKEGAVKTRYKDFKVGTRRGKVAFDLGYESYRGFNRTRSDDDTKLPASGARVDGRFINIFYLPFGDDLDEVRTAQAAGDDERQFAWSPVAVVTYDRLDLAATGGVGVPPAGAAPDDTRLDRGRFEGFGASVGAAMGVSGHGLGMYMAITTGALFEGQHYGVDEASISRSDRERRTNFRMNLEYDALPWRGGMAIMEDTGRHNLRNATLTSHEGVFEMYVGRAVSDFF